MSRIYDALRKAQREKEQEAGSVDFRREPRRHPALKPLDYEKGSPSMEATSPAARQEEPSVPVRTDFLEKTGYRPPDEKLAPLMDPQSAPAEQFRKIRTAISHFRATKGCRTIMVTSALPGEGKTLIACNIGAAIAQGLDDQAILIDCDLRKPGVHHLFGFNGGPGLTELLEGKKELRQVVHEANGLKLKVIPAGRKTLNPAELLSSEKMANLLSELKLVYHDHYIIVDVTPILSTSEAAILAPLMDGIILVVLAAKTPRDLVKRAVKEIVHDKIIGVVLNYCELENGRYPSYHGYFKYTQSSGKENSK